MTTIHRPLCLALLLLALPLDPDSRLAAESSPGDVAESRRRLELRSLIAERVGLLGAPVASSGVVVGLHGLSASSGDHSAGAIGESAASSGRVYGVRARSSSPQGVAGLFENTAGGYLLLGTSQSTVPFAVDSAGNVTAADFVGDANGVVGGSGLTCTGCVGSDDIADGAITADRLATESVGRLAIADGAVDETKIAPGAVGSEEIRDGDVTPLKIADGAVGSSRLSDDAVGSDQIADGSVTTFGLDSGAISRRKLTLWNVMAEVYLLNADCTDSGEPTRETTCASRLCQTGPPILYLDCSGSCSSSAPQFCPNPGGGWLLNQ